MLGVRGVPRWHPIAGPHDLAGGPTHEHDLADIVALRGEARARLADRDAVDQRFDRASERRPEAGAAVHAIQRRAVDDEVPQLQRRYSWISVASEHLVSSTGGHAGQVVREKC